MASLEPTKEFSSSHKLSASAPVKAPPIIATPKLTDFEVLRRDFPMLASYVSPALWIDEFRFSRNQI
jgi:hypothetical protein